MSFLDWIFISKFLAVIVVIESSISKHIIPKISESDVDLKSGVAAISFAFISSTFLPSAAVRCSLNSLKEFILMLRKASKSTN